MHILEGEKAMLNNQLHKEWLEHIDDYINGQIELKNLSQTTESHAEKVIDYVDEQSSFYREHLRNKSGSSSQFKVLDGVPFTTKEDLRFAGTSVCSLPFDKIAMYYETTGTTGTPTPCPRSSIDVETSGAFVKKAMNDVYQARFGTMNALTAIMGPSELYAFGDTYGEICRKLGIPFVRLWPESPRVGLDKAAHLITNLGVRSLICSPAVALALARFYTSIGLVPRETSVDQIFVLGELCTPEMLQNIAHIWGANCNHGLYGSQEAHAVATGCSQGNLHFCETNYLAEILPISGLEGVGELCLTMLVPGAKPLIRFRTGDLASFSPATNCSCGSHSRCLKVFGRVDDIITIAGRQMLPASIESAVLGAVDNVLGYQVAVSTADNGTETIEVSVIATIEPGSIAQIQKKMTDYFAIPVKLTVTEQLDARTETGAYVSWKHARIIDNRKSN
jgi:phenylacetate-CoA ligase